LIPEARLKLPPENSDVRQLLYIHEPQDNGQEGNDYTWNTPESIQITTSQLSTTTRQRLFTTTNVDDLFKQVPEAQACSRGFRLVFAEINPEEESGLEFSGSRNLDDGRKLFVYRETECKYISEIVDSLETYLLQAQSY
jgi:hypothetical protein